MEIVWLGHSSLRITSRNVTLVTDPYRDSLGVPMPRHSAQIVTVSHEHPHHSHLDAVDGGPRVLSGQGEYEIGSFYVSGMGTRRIPEPEGDEADRQINTVFTIRAEGLTLCHLGDLAETLTPGQVEELNQTDVLFVPAGGTCTISAARATELANLIGPRIVVPLHYRTDGLKVELKPLDAFLSEMGVAEVSSQPRLSVTSSSLPRDRRVDVLQPPSVTRGVG